MEFISIAWADFKSFISSNAAAPKYLELSDGYILRASAGYFNVEVRLIKGGSDCIDFETDYKGSIIL